MARNLDYLFSYLIGVSSRFDEGYYVLVVISCISLYNFFLFVTLFDSSFIIDGYIKRSLDFRFAFMKF